MDVWLISQQWNTSKSDLASFPDLPLTKRVIAKLSVSLPSSSPVGGMVAAGLAISHHEMEASCYSRATGGRDPVSDDYGATIPAMDYLSQLLCETEMKYHLI